MVVNNLNRLCIFWLKQKRASCDDIGTVGAQGSEVGLPPKAGGQGS